MDDNNAINNPRLTVLMVVYNEPLDFVRVQIDSILNQTYKDFSFLILSDNPNNMKLNRFIAEFTKNDKRVRFLVNEKNLGIPKAKNAGLALCNSEYIAISDADDYCHPERFAKQIKYLDSHPDVVVVGSYALMMNEKGKIIGEMHTGADDKYLKTMLPFEQPIYHPSMVFRRIVSGKPVRYNEEMKISLDYELCFQFSDYKMTNITDYLLNYRLSQNQTTQLFKEKYIDYSGAIRKRALFKMYNGMSDNDADALITLYYRSNCDTKQVKDVGGFILHLYNNNKNNESVYIDSAITFLLIKYLKFLFQNTSGVKALISFIRVNHSLGNRFYIKAISKLSGKIFSNVRYKLCRV